MTANMDAIDRLREIVNNSNDIRRREHRINVMFGLSWLAFIAIAVLLWVTR